MMQSKIDELGKILAQIEELDAHATAIKDEIKACGDGEFLGEQYRALVTSSVRKTIDYKKVLSEAAVPQEIILKNTKETDVVTLKVSIIKPTIDRNAEVIYD